MARKFIGYKPEARTLLGRLPELDKEQFSARRNEYVAALLEPTKLLVNDVGGLLEESISPELIYQAKTNGSIAPINNDVRFADARAPLYKDHFLLRYWQGPNKKNAPTLFLRVASENVGFATGMSFTKSGLDTWRSAVAGPEGKALAAAVDAVLEEFPPDPEDEDAFVAEVAGDALKKVPAPYDQDHERAKLLKLKSFQLRWSMKMPTSVGSRKFPDWCADQFDRAAPIHHWLVENCA
jgi:uncharacterized protein (DUF2461 family)